MRFDFLTVWLRRRKQGIDITISVYLCHLLTIFIQLVFLTFTVWISSKISSFFPAVSTSAHPESKTLELRITCGRSSLLRKSLASTCLEILEQICRALVETRREEKSWSSSDTKRIHKGVKILNNIPSCDPRHVQLKALRSFAARADESFQASQNDEDSPRILSQKHPKIVKIYWFCGHKLCHFLSQLKGTFCRTPPVSSAAIISNPVLPASSFSTISAPFLGGVRGGVARSTWSTKLIGLWVEPPIQGGLNQVLTYQNDGIWSTYLDWWWSHLSPYESHLGAIYSKTIILARVQEEQQFKATPATMTSTDFRAEGSLGGTVHRPWLSGSPAN